MKSRKELVKENADLLAKLNEAESSARELRVNTALNPANSDASVDWIIDGLGIREAYPNERLSYCFGTNYGRTRFMADIRAAHELKREETETAVRAAAVKRLRDALNKKTSK